MLKNKLFPKKFKKFDNSNGKMNSESKTYHSKKKSVCKRKLKNKIHMNKKLTIFLQGNRTHNGKLYSFSRYIIALIKRVMQQNEPTKLTNAICSVGKRRPLKLYFVV